MEKTWKERLYEFCALPGSLCVVSFVLMFTIVGLALLGYRYNTLFALLTLLSLPAVLLWNISHDVIVSIKKETFFSNKVTHLLFANERFVDIILFVATMFPLGFIIFSLPEQPIIHLISAVGLGVVGKVLKKQILNHFKNKVI